MDEIFRWATVDLADGRIPGGAGSRTPGADLLHASGAADADARKAYEYAYRAAGEATRQGAFELAARQLERALGAVRQLEPPGSALEAELMVEIAEAHARAGQPVKATAAATRAGELPACRSDGVLLARAALAGRGSTALRLRNEPAVLEMLEAALRALPDEVSALRTLVQSRLAASSYFTDRDAARREALSDAAVAMARRLGDPGLMRSVLEDRHLALRFPGGRARRAETAAELVRLAEATGNPAALAVAYAARAGDLTEACDMQAAEHDVARYAAIAVDLGDPDLQWRALVWRAMQAQLEGRWNEAQTLVHDVFFAGRELDEALATFTLGAQSVTLSIVRGRVDGVFAQLQLMTELYPQFPVIRAILALACLLTGRVAAARGEAERVLAGGIDEIAWNTTSVTLLGSLGAVYARLGDLRRCDEIYERLLPYDEDNMLTGLYGTVSFGPAARVLGILAGVLQRWDAAEEHFESSLRLCERLGSGPWRVFSQYGYGVMLLARARGGDAKRGARLLSEAGRGARALGMSLGFLDALGARLLHQSGWA